MAEETVATTGAGDAGTTASTADVGSTNTGASTQPAETSTGTPAASATTETAPKGDAGTVAATGTQPATEKVITPTWPSDWRQQMAGEDKDYVKQLERYASPQDLIKKLKSQDALISTFKQPLPKDATPEQVAAYRKDNGIPEAANKYDLTLKDGLKVGDQEKPVVDKLLETMHGQNLNNSQVKAVLESYYEMERASKVEREKQVAAAKMATEDELRKEWGGEYRGEINRVENLLSTYSEQSRAAIQSAVDSAGAPLLNNPHFLRDLAAQARIINPVSTVVAGGGTAQAASVDTEIAEIEKRMGGSDPTYYKDARAHARYIELVGWRENQKKRG